MSSDDEVDPEDYDYFIEELQELIKDAPSAMQARFAKVIIFLRQKKIQIKETFNDFMKGKGEKKEIDLTKMLQYLENQMTQSTSQEDRFSTALKMAQTREKISTSDSKTEKKGAQTNENNTKSQTNPTNDSPGVLIFEDIASQKGTAKNKELKPTDTEKKSEITSNENKKDSISIIQSSASQQNQSENQSKEIYSSDPNILKRDYSYDLPGYISVVIPIKEIKNEDQIPKEEPKVVQHVEKKPNAQEEQKSEEKTVSKEPSESITAENIKNRPPEPQIPLNPIIQSQTIEKTEKQISEETKAKQIKKGIFILNQDLEKKIESMMEQGIDAISNEYTTLEEDPMVKLEQKIEKINQTTSEPEKDKEKSKVMPFVEFKEVKQLPVDLSKSKEKVINPPPTPDYLKPLSKDVTIIHVLEVPAEIIEDNSTNGSQKPPEHETSILGEVKAILNAPETISIKEPGSIENSEPQESEVEEFKPEIVESVESKESAVEESKAEVAESVESKESAVEESKAEVAESVESKESAVEESKTEVAESVESKESAVEESKAEVAESVESKESAVEESKAEVAESVESKESAVEESKTEVAESVESKESAVEESKAEVAESVESKESAVEESKAEVAESVESKESAVEESESVSSEVPGPQESTAEESESVSSEVPEPQESTADESESVSSEVPEPQESTAEESESVSSEVPEPQESTADESESVSSEVPEPQESTAEGSESVSSEVPEPQESTADESESVSSEVPEPQESTAEGSESVSSEVPEPQESTADESESVSSEVPEPQESTADESESVSSEAPEPQESTADESESVSSEAPEPQESTNPENVQELKTESRPYGKKQSHTKASKKKAGYRKKSSKKTGRR